MDWPFKISKISKIVLTLVPMDKILSVKRANGLILKYEREIKVLGAL